MNTLSKLILALTVLVSMALSPTLALANVVQDESDSTAELNACQEALARFDNVIDEIEPVNSSTEEDGVVEIEVTPGAEPTAETQSTITDCETQLEVIADFVCTDPVLQDYIWGKNGGFDTENQVRAIVELISTDFTDYSATEVEYNIYLRQAAADGFAVPTRTMTLYERVLERPGCSEGAQLVK